MTFTPEINYYFIQILNADTFSFKMTSNINFVTFFIRKKYSKHIFVYKINDNTLNIGT